jgi:predicted phage terminase large subunit-like protein
MIATNETTKEKLRDVLLEKMVSQSRSDFFTFTKAIAPILIPDFVVGKHIEVICDTLQKVSEGEIKRQMVFLPPRSSKSLLCSKIFPAWHMGLHPAHQILCVSHSDRLATDFGRSVRDIVNDPLFSVIFPGVSLRKDVRAAGKWETNQNGVYFAAGVKSQIAGRGAHVAILDDVMSEEDAFSEAGRRYVKDWYPAGLRTRMMPNGGIIIINTRYHEDDICGWLLRSSDEDDWNVLKIPAWIDEESSKILSLPVGSSYFPEWKTTESLKLDETEIKKYNGTRYWEALYMQNPVPAEGGLLKKIWFQEWEHDDPPECDFIIQTLDTAFSTRSTADNSVIQTWGIFESIEVDSSGQEHHVGNLILLSNVVGKFEYPELRMIAQDLYSEHSPDVMIIEKKASGQSLIQDLRRAGLPIREYTPDKDKVSRVNAISPLVESGRIWIPKEKPWGDSLILEAASFPNAAHDDQVDAMTMAIHYMRESWRLEHPYDSSYNQEDEPPVGPRGNKTYWNSVAA